MSDPEAPVQPRDPPSRNRLWLTLALIVVVVFAAVVASRFGRTSDAQLANPDDPAQWDQLFGQHSRPATLQEGLGPIHMAVSTQVPAAQQWFDQGLAQLFGFAHEDAIRSFQMALELDPGLAIANWGIAYAYGPNINLGMDAWRGERANDALSQAIALGGGVSPLERALIDSLTVRFSADPNLDPFGSGSRAPLDRAYWQRMKTIMAEFPDDTNVATLTAEAGLDLIPWRAWNYNGKPTLPVTELSTPAIPEILEVKRILEDVMARDPDHIGALHYYIHGVEASQESELALPAAERIKSLAWGQPHLVHAASHIYARVGDWGSAMVSGFDAIVQDEEVPRPGWGSRSLLDSPWRSQPVLPVQRAGQRWSRPRNSRADRGIDRTGARPARSDACTGVPASDGAQLPRSNAPMAGRPRISQTRPSVQSHLGVLAHQSRHRPRRDGRRRWRPA